MNLPRRKKTKKAAEFGRGNKASSHREDFKRVMRELKKVGSTHADADPLVECLRKCPETFVVGEKLGKMFDNLRCKGETTENERLHPPAEAVLPLF
jgi:hypothetical protein